MQFIRKHKGYTIKQYTIHDIKLRGIPEHYVGDYVVLIDGDVEWEGSLQECIDHIDWLKKQKQR